MKNILYVIPSSLVNNDSSSSFSEDYLKIIYNLQHFVVENVRTTRRFLSRIGHPIPISDMEFHELNKHTSTEDWIEIQQFLEESHNTGLLSEAGCPGVADPGADLVVLAHQLKMKVVPLIGPSSILMGLMASGLNGQNFCFNGYLDRNEGERRQQIKMYEKESKNKSRTQIFIETPYRNDALFQSLTRSLKPDTRLALACELTDPRGWVKSKTIAEWKGEKPPIHKKNTVFLFLA